MDVCRLSQMTVLDYLKNYCVVCSRRQQLYKQSFIRADKDRDGFLTLADLKDTLTNVIYVQPDAKSCFEELIGLISEKSNKGNEQNQELKVNLQTFKGIGALLERMICWRMDKHNSSDGIRWSQYDRRNTLEQTDFDGLKWKLKGCKINSKLQVVFKYL